MSAATGNSSRRAFLKTAAAASVSTAAGLSLARSAHAAGNSTIKIGMIGCGGRCSGAATEALRQGPDVRLVAMADIFQNRMEAARRLFQAQIDSTRMAILGQIACYTGQPVRWEQLQAADFEFEPKLATVSLEGDPPTRPDETGNYPLPIPGLTRYL